MRPGARRAEGQGAALAPSALRDSKSVFISLKFRKK